MTKNFEESEDGLGSRFATLAVDAIFLGLIGAFGIYLVFFYIGATYINTGYPDWLVHAFRVKFLQEFGYSSWTHIWSNGINLWQAYQFVPQYITLWVSKFTGAGITQTMVHITIAIFILLRIEIYILLRILKFPPIVSLIASAFSFGIGQYWQGVGDYSIMFAYLAFPIYVFLWKYYMRGRIEYIFPYLVGVGFYIHPVLTFYAGVLWVVGLFLSEKRVISVNSLIESVAFFVGASFFLYPLILPDAEHFTNSFFSSKKFFNLLSVNYQWAGLSFSLLALLVTAIVRAFVPIEGAMVWVKKLTVVSVFLLVIVFISKIETLPYIISAFQVPRGVPMIGIAISMAGAGAIDSILKAKSAFFRMFLTILISYSLVEAVFSVSALSAPPFDEFKNSEVKYLVENKNSEVANSRIWSPTIDFTTFLAPSSIRLPYSYLGHLDSNPVSPRMNEILVHSTYDGVAPPAAVERMEAYFKLTGVKFAFFDELSPFVKAIDKSETEEPYVLIDKVEVDGAVSLLYRVPWANRNAVLTEQDLEGKLQPLFNVESSELDGKVLDFVSAVYDERNEVLPISYPTQDSLIVGVPQNRDSDTVFINESYSRDWKATLDGQAQKIEPAGPNYMKVILSGGQNGGNLELVHSWPHIYGYLALLVMVAPFVFVLPDIFAKKHGKN